VTGSRWQFWSGAQDCSDARLLAFRHRHADSWSAFGCWGALSRNTPAKDRSGEEAMGKSNGEGGKTDDQQPQSDY
jgi:hypothetical protein